MKRKLTSILLLSTIAFSSSYTFAEQPNQKDGQQVVEQEETKTALEGQKQPKESTQNEEASDEEVKINGLEQVPTLEELDKEIGNNRNTNEEINVPEDLKGNSFTNEVILTLNSKTAVVNGNKEQLLNPPTVVKDTTFLPLRFVVDEIIGGQLVWDEKTNTVVVTRGDTEVIVTIGSNVAKVNGISTTVEAAPFVANGTTMLPLRFIGENFGIDIKYDSATKQISLIGEDDRPNTPPSAYFSFGQLYYTQGQTINITESSTDPEHDKIVAREWKVSGDMDAAGSDIKAIFKKPKAGNYTVALRVKDKRGLWSEWCEKSITVEPNKPPVVTFLEPLKGSYAQGENIKLTYSYENESWEAITNEKWTYRHEGDPANKAILGKPKALFTEGNYIVTLELDDAFGNRSEKFETTLHITGEILKSELMYRFTEGTTGEVIDNYEKINYRDYKDVVLSHTSRVAGTMIMSDSPEVVSRDGLLYRDSINGKGSILLHHLNGYDPNGLTGDNRRLVLVAENTSSKPVTLTIGNKSVKGPATDVLRIGQRVLYDYLVGSKDEVHTLAPGERKFIYDSKATKWTNGQCISGLMDIETTGEVKFTSAVIKHGVTLKDMVGMELLQQDVHPRGTFDATKIIYKASIEGSEPTKLLIGTGTEEWVNGHDAITGAVVQNRGNFGITYRITLTATVDTGVILNPRATNFKGAIKWDDDASKVYNVPETGSFTADTTKAAVLGVIKAGETRTLEYMLPNGSAAPILLGFIPKEYWNN